MSTTSSPKCTKCKIEDPVTGLIHCVKCTKIMLKLHEEKTKEERQRKNQNAETILELNSAIEKSLTRAEQERLLEFIPEEAKTDAKELIDILRGYTQSKHPKNKSRKEDEAKTKITHLYYGYHTPAIVITPQHVLAPKSLGSQMVSRANQMEAVHPNSVNYLSNGARMLQSVLSGVPDVMRSEKNEEAVLCEKVEKEFWKAQRKKRKKDQNIESEEDDNEDEMKFQSLHDEDDTNGPDDSQMEECEDDTNSRYDERFESVENSSRLTGPSLKLPRSKKPKVHYPVLRNQPKEPLSEPVNHPAWNAELNAIASTPKLTKTNNEKSGYLGDMGSIEFGMTKMPPPYPGYQDNHIIAVAAGTNSEDVMSPICGPSMSSTAGPASPMRLVAEERTQLPLSNDVFNNPPSPVTSGEGTATVYETIASVTGTALSTIESSSGRERTDSPFLQVRPSHTSSHHTPMSVQTTSFPTSETTPIKTMPSAVNTAVTSPCKTALYSVQNHPKLIQTGTNVWSMENMTKFQSLPKPKENSSVKSRKGLRDLFAEEAALSEDSSSESTSSFRFSRQVQESDIVPTLDGASSGIEMKDPAAQGMEICKPVTKPAQPQIPAKRGCIDEKDDLNIASDEALKSKPRIVPKGHPVIPSISIESSQDGSEVPKSLVDNTKDDEERSQWMGQLENFMNGRETPVKAPIIAKKELDLFKLYKFTKDEGGFVECVKNKAWKKIADRLEIGHSTSSTTTLRRHYEKCILPYECHMDRGGADPTSILAEVDAMKRILKPQDKNSKKTDRFSPRSTSPGNVPCLGSPQGMARPPQNVSLSTPLLASDQLATAQIVNSNGEETASFKLYEDEVVAASEKVTITLKAPEMALPPIQSPTPGNVVVRKYDPKAAAVVKRRDEEQFIVSPITEERIPANKVAEHMKVGLLDPMSVEERDKHITVKTTEDKVFAPGKAKREKQSSNILENLKENDKKIDHPTVVESQRPKRNGRRSLRQHNPEFLVKIPVLKTKDSVPNVGINLSKAAEVREFSSKLEKVEDSQNIKMQFVADASVTGSILNLSQDPEMPFLK